MAQQTSKIQMRRGLSAAWESANPTLSYGEPGFETNDNASRFKIGNGVQQWSDLPHLSLHGQKVAIGLETGLTSQGSGGVAIGYIAGNANQGENGVSIGFQCGTTSQGSHSVAIGSGAGTVSQGSRCVAIGSGSGDQQQGAGSIAIGHGAGYQEQGVGAVAIGQGAGQINQGDNSIAIGKNAGYGVSNQQQQNNTIVLNASGGTVNAQFENSFYVAPIRDLHGIVTGFYPLLYNPLTHEIAFNSGS